MPRPAQGGPVRVAVAGGRPGQRRPAWRHVLARQRAAGVADVQHRAGPHQGRYGVRGRRVREGAGPRGLNRRAGQLMHPVGNLQNLAVGGQPFHGEAFDQPGPGPAPCLQGKFPGQVGAVVQAGVQALATERAGQMTGVTEQEAPRVSQPGGEAALHPERGGPGHIVDPDQAGRDPAANRRGDRAPGGITAQFLGFLVVEVTDESEPAPAGQRREEHVALRAADQRGPVPGQPARHAHVGDQGRARVGRARQVLAHGCPGRAVRAARADHPGCFRLALRAVRFLERGQDAVRPLGDGHDGDPALHPAAQFGEPPGEDLLGPPLRQAALELPRASDAREGLLGQAAEAVVEDPREPHVNRGPEHPVQASRLLKNFQRRGLQRRGPGLPVRLRRPFDDPGPYAVLRQFQCREQARRPGPDHQDVRPARSPHTVPLDAIVTQSTRAGTEGRWR